MAELMMPESRALAYVLIEKRTLHLLGAQLLFNQKGELMAAKDQAYAYYLDRVYSSVEMKSINKFAGKDALIRVWSGDFDFVVGSILSKAGLPLTRRPQEQANG